MIEYAGICFRDDDHQSSTEQCSAHIRRKWFVATIAGFLLNEGGMHGKINMELDDIVPWSKLWYHWKFMNCSYGHDIDARLVDLDAFTLTLSSHRNHQKASNMPNFD